MRFDFGNGFGIIGVHFVSFRAVLFRFLYFRGNLAVFKINLTQFLSEFRLVGNSFGNNVFSAGDRLFDACDAEFFVHERFCKILDRPLRHVLSVNDIGKRFKPFRDSDRRSRFSLLFIRSVNIFNLGECFRCRKRRGNLVGHFSLFRYRFGNLFFSLLDIAKISKPVGKFSQYLIVDMSRHLFSVTGDERYRVPLVEKFNDILYVVLPEFEFLRNLI